MTAPIEEATLAERRRRMVDRQMRARGIVDPRVLDALACVPRHRFVRPEDLELAYGDHPLDIGLGQTISQPYIVAFMSEALDLQPQDRVLEIGTGCGYQTAVLAELAAEVYSVEIVPPHADAAAAVLRELGYTNVHLRTGDGHAGWPEAAPFDAVIVTAAPEHLPQPLVDQLKVGRRMVVPLGRGDQELLTMQKEDDGMRVGSRLPVRFVPLTRAPSDERPPDVTTR